MRHHFISCPIFPASVPSVYSVAMLFLFGAIAHAQPVPKLGAVFPIGGQQGSAPEISFYGQNLSNALYRNMTYSPTTPGYAQPTQYRDNGIDYVLSLRGEF